MKNKQILVEIATKIHNLGGDVYYVGGYVRDNILGLDNKDIDVEIHNISLEDTLSILRGYGKVDEVGKQFGVLKVWGLDIDFAFPRSERKVGEKHTDFEVDIDPYIGLKNASKRRDFTMNSILQNVLTNEYVDFYGGISDIKQKVICYVAEETFIEDSLRPLRACQFASRLDFEISPEVISLSQQMSYKQLSKERIKVELDKALLSKNPAKAFNYLLEMGILEQILPEIARLKDCPQNITYHPEGDVWKHTMLVLNEGALVKHKAKEPLYFMYACLLHDIGKPKSTILEDGKYTSKGHDIEGSKICVQVLDKITTEKDLKKYVEKMTLYHMKAHSLLKIKEFKVSKMMLDVEMNDLLLLNFCDISGREVSESQVNRVKEFKQKENLVRKLSNGSFGEIIPYIQGKDLINLGLSPSKEFKTILDNCFLLQLTGKSEKEIRIILENKYTKKKESIPIENVYLKHLGAINYGTQKNNKQEKLSIRFNQLRKGYAKKFKWNSTQQQIPYLTTIFLGEEKKKIYFFQDFCFVSSLDDSETSVLFHMYDSTKEERMKQLRKIFNYSKLNDFQKECIMSMYDNLK